MQQQQTSLLKRSLLGLRRGLQVRRFCLIAMLWHVAILLSLAQMLGVTHAIADCFQLAADEGHCVDRCANEEVSGDAECPPFCPTCSCAHASRPLVQTPQPDQVLVLLSPPERLDLPLIIWLYDSPTAASIFRPPRS